MQRQSYSRRFTSKQEVEICSRYQNGESGVALAKALDASLSAVYRTLSRANIKRDAGRFNRSLTPNEEREVCARYLSGEAAHKIGKTLGLGTNTITKTLARNNVTLRSKPEIQRRYTCNHSFFDVIDSEEKAYWLGFLAADGCVTGNAMVIQLAKRDEDHLHRMRRCLQSTHPIKQYRGSSYKPDFYPRLSVCSDQLTAALANHGVVPRKTFTLEWPHRLLAGLLRHYARGYMDGDGGFHPRKQKGQRPGVWFEVTGNQAFILSYQRFLAANCQLRITKLSRRGHVYNLRYVGNLQVTRIARFFYQDAAIHLPRKRDVVAHLL